VSFGFILVRFEPIHATPQQIVPRERSADLPGKANSVRRGRCMIEFRVLAHDHDIPHLAVSVSVAKKTHGAAGFFISPFSISLIYRRPQVGKKTENPRFSWLLRPSPFPRSRNGITYSAAKAAAMFSQTIFWVKFNAIKSRKQKAPSRHVSTSARRRQSHLSAFLANYSSRQYSPNYAMRLLQGSAFLAMEDIFYPII